MRLLCVSVHQPWASLMAKGLKTVRAASYATRHRGPTGIHACKTRGGATGLAMMDEDVRVAMALADIPHDRFTPDGFSAGTPFGAILAIADLIDCVPAEGAPEQYLEEQRRHGDYTPGRYLWVFRDAKPLSAPLPARGNVAPFYLEIPTTTCQPSPATGAATTSSGRGRQSARKMSSAV